MERFNKNRYTSEVIEREHTINLFRTQTHETEQTHIGSLAADLVNSGDTVILDVGPTTMAVAQSLLLRHDLHSVVVFTNAIHIAMTLEKADPRITVVVGGGTLLPGQHALVAPMAGLIWERLEASIAFLDCNGIDDKVGATHSNLAEAEIKQQMAQAATRCVLVADGSKVGQVTLASVCNVQDIDTLITDTSADSHILAALRLQGVHIMLAK